MSYGAKQYKQTAVQTASRGTLLIMLYEAAIGHLKRAQDAIDAKDIAAKGTAIGKAHDIVNELVSTLDFSIGGQIAKDLERLYNFMAEQLLKANLENQKEPLQIVQKLMQNLLEGWRGAVEQYNKNSNGSKS